MPRHGPNNLARNPYTSSVAGRVSCSRHNIAGLQRFPQFGAGLFCARDACRRTGAGWHVNYSVGQIVFSLPGAASDSGLSLVSTQSRWKEMGESLFFAAGGIMGRVVSVAGVGFVLFYVRAGGHTGRNDPILSARRHRPADCGGLRVTGGVLFQHIPGSAEKADSRSEMRLVGRVRNR